MKRVFKSHNHPCIIRLRDQVVQWGRVKIFVEGLIPRVSEAHCGYASLHEYVITIILCLCKGLAELFKMQRDPQHTKGWETLVYCSEVESNEENFVTEQNLIKAIQGIKLKNSECLTISLKRTNSCNNIEFI